MPPKMDRLSKLISLYLDEQISDDELAELERLLASRDDGIDAVLELSSTHAHLRLLTLSNLAARPVAEPDEKPRSVSLRQRATRTLLVAAAAAVAASLMTVVAYRQYTNPVAELADSKVVASIVRKIDCDSESERWMLVNSTELAKGQTVAISRGLMEIEFTSGAMVTLEAPAALTAETPMSMTLLRGRMTASVPPPAHGFTVRTPTGDVVDLGTEFGVFVGEKGETETHVFDGEVLVRTPSTVVAGKVEERMLTTANGLRVEPFGLGRQNIQVNRRAFTEVDFESSEPPYQLPLTDGLRLWYSANGPVKLDTEDRVVALANLADTGGPSAWQVNAEHRPRWIGPWHGGGAAMRFDGHHSLVTEPIEFGTDISVAVVFAFDPAALAKLEFDEDIGRMLLNMNGPPNLAIDMRSNGELWTRMHTAIENNMHGGWPRSIDYASFKYEQMRPLQRTVALLTYAGSQGTSQLFVDGQLIGTADAKQVRSTYAPRYIGIHPNSELTGFVGEIAELIVYDRGLSEQEAKAVMRTLQEPRGSAQE